MTNFKKAVELIEENDIDGLKELIEKNPAVLEVRSRYNNNLLHEAGVEETERDRYIVV